MTTHVSTNFTIDQDIISCVQESFMQIRLTTSSFGTQATNREKSAQVTEEANAARDAGRVVVNRLPGAAKHHHARVTKLQNDARDLIATHTTPWDESGWRLLATTKFDPLMRQLVPMNESFKRYMEEYATEADMVLTTARREMGDLGDQITLPSAETLIKAYTMKMDIVPVPDGAQFKGNLPLSVREALGKRLQKAIEASYERGITSIMDRLRPCLETAVERLDAFDARLAQQAQGVEVGRVGAFRDSLISNFVPILDLLQAMDVAGDSRIKEMAAKVRAIVEHSPQELRDNDAARAVVKQTATETIDLLSQWGV